MEAVQIKAGGGAGEGAALRDGWDGWLVAWWVCWFGRVFAWLVGRLVGCMDGWMLCKWRARRLHRPRTGFLVSTALGENTELWFGCLVGWFVGLAALLLGWLVGWLALRDGCMDGWMLCKWGGRGASPAMPPHGISSIYGTCGKHGVMVWLLAWLVCWLGRVVAWLVGRLVGTPGWMDGWILCCLTFRRRPGQFPAVPVVPESLCAVSGGF